VKIVFEKLHFVLPIYIEGVVFFMIKLYSFIIYFGHCANSLILFYFNKNKKAQDKPVLYIYLKG